MNTEPATRHGKFEYNDSWPDELISVVQSHLIQLEWLVPSWAQVVGLYYVTDSSTANASCEIDYGQRWITIRIFPAWFKANEFDRMESLIHELVHGFGKVFADYARSTIGTLLPEPSQNILHDVIIKQMNERNEQMTEDLAFALTRKLYPELQKPSHSTVLTEQQKNQ